MINVRTSVQSVLVGAAVEFECLVVGDPKARITWSKVGSRIRPEVVVSGGMVKIERVEQSDAGQYRCTATNDMGTMQSNVILHVQCKCLLPCGGRPIPLHLPLHLRGGGSLTVALALLHRHTHYTSAPHWGSRGPVLACRAKGDASPHIGWGVGGAAAGPWAGMPAPHADGGLKNVFLHCSHPPDRSSAGGQGGHHGVEGSTPMPGIWLPCPRDQVDQGKSLISRECPLPSSPGQLLPWHSPNE